MHYSPTAFLLSKWNLGMQFDSNDKTVRGITVQGLKDFNSQLLLTQAKKMRTSSFSHPC